MIVSFGNVLDDSKGFGKGFDFLRIALAISIILWHCATLTGNLLPARATPFWFVEYALVPMFFMLSGFLVAGSGMRLSLKNFMLNRSVRIVPALAADVVFSALLLGPIMTTLPLGDYFTDRTFFSYFANVVGWIHYLLPGVFKTNPSINVNGALWTVPYEIGCYLLFGGMMIGGILQRSKRLLLLAAAVLGLAILAQLAGFRDTSGARENIGSTLVSFLFLEKGARLLPSFIIGIIFYNFRFKIPFDIRILAAICATALLVAIFGNHETLFFNALFHAVALPALGYITIFLGLTPIRNPYPFTKGDYSYGLYLYHAPFMQAIIASCPWLLTGGRWWMLFPMAFPLVFAVAYFSWHVIEKPTLAVRKRFSFAEKMREKEQADALSSRTKTEPDGKRFA